MFCERRLLLNMVGVPSSSGLKYLNLCVVERLIPSYQALEELQQRQKNKLNKTLCVFSFPIYLKCISQGPASGSKISRVRQIT